MKRILPLFLALALLLTGCTAVSTTESTSQTVSQVDSPSSAPESASSQLESISITDSNGSQITLDTSAPRVVAAYGSFAEAWLLAGGELCGVTQDALEQRDLGLPEDIAVVGTVKEPNAEEIIALEPDLVLLASDITAQADIRDVLENAGLACAFFQVDTFADYAFMMEQLCAVTGREDLYEENVTQVGQQIEEAQANAVLSSTRPNVLLIRAFSTGIKAKTDDELAGAILKDLGAHNIADDHPSMLEDLSLEEVIAADPDYIFVLDRDAAIQTEGAQLAQEIVENELVKGTRAYTDGHIVYLSSPAVWYTAEGGITALDVMLQDLESELLSQ